ncbi:hypothetical protein E2K93_04215 [Thalassotalea sp. HSM 43]|uniref:LURP-one-related/scramblase family protein n=1 Tax=Thalassotalea sp. HSM 43 TaxID=2552945 RepID=UPI00107FE759|nr:LURP-one-related family protein [Thalassotalea sp. HSM 43]QBY03632.1 hypothetical protein E2K93_04215 [Thalassotalea sp. HSM 43]
MKRFQLQQKLFSLAENFKVTDENEQVAYQVSGKLFSIGKRFTLFDAQGRELAQIKQKLMAFRPTFFITFNDGLNIRVRKMFTPLFKSRFVADFDDREVTIMGNFLSHEYQFTEQQQKQEQQLAQVSKSWFSMTDCYGLEVENDDFSAIALAIVIVIDAIHHTGDDG